MNKLRNKLPRATESIYHKLSHRISFRSISTEQFNASSDFNSADEFYHDSNQLVAW